MRARAGAAMADAAVATGGCGKENGNHRSNGASGNGNGAIDLKDLEGSLDEEVAEEEERAGKAWAAAAVVVASVVVFVAEMYVNDCGGGGGGRRRCFAGFLRRMSFQPLRENPLLGPSSSTLVKLGALEWSKIIHQHQGWRLVSGIWLHAGAAHLILNMLCMGLVGFRLEQRFGSVRFACIYLLSGLGGSVSSMLFARNYVSAGASTALFGVLGSVISELLVNWTIYSTKVASLLALSGVVAANLGLGVFPRVGNIGNIGGFGTGFLLGFSLLMRPQLGWMERREKLPPGIRAKSKHSCCQNALCLVANLLLVHLFTIGLVMLFLEKNLGKGCEWCHYLSCLPTSRWTCVS